MTACTPLHKRRPRLIRQTERLMSTSTTLPPFHLAFPVHDLAAARAFYGALLGCPEGRSSDQWVDFNFHGHQIVAHLSPAECAGTQTSSVGDHNRSEEQTPEST